MPSLVVERGQEKGFSFPLSVGETMVVGRDPANPVIISDPASSRRHFQIRHDDGIWLVSDLGSRNSTYVNEEKLEAEQALAFGDRIQVGETVFSFLEEDETKKGKAAGLAGKDIAGYKILERVGRGGMGTVYKARQISLNRICAFKVLSARYASDETFVEQFVAEARAAAQLNHPNVVQVFDVGQAGGIHFFSMEFMEGGAIQDLLSSAEDGRLHWTEAMPLLLDACKGLVFAERHGIVHRDIKPDNLMLTVENKVKIGDLGLAAKTDQAGDGKIFGTPHFIAPEQARGKDVGHTADIYALGASFYRMVVGRTPFSGTTVKEILRKQIGEPHVPVVDEVEGFPPDLSAILDKMMAKKVEERYQSASDLLSDLEAFEIEHKIELAGGRKRNKGVLIVAAIVILALGGVIAWQLSKAPERETITKIIKDNTRPERTGPSDAELARMERERRESDARAAFFETKASDPSNSIQLAEKDPWLQQADAYDKLATEWDGTPSAKDAADRSREIRETLDRLEKEYEETIGQAQTWWEAEKQKIDEKLTAEDWKGVLDAAQRLPGTRDAKKHLQHVPEATTYLSGLETEVLKRARTSFDGVLAAAQKMIDDGKPGEGIASVEAWADEMKTHAGAHAELAQLEADARAWAKEKGEAIRDALADLIVQDRLAYIELTRSVRTTADAAPTRKPSVFDWAFAEAADELESQAGTLKTWLYQDRLARRIASLRAAEAGWNGFVASLSAGELIEQDERILGMSGMPPGAKVTLSSSKKVTEKEIAFEATIGPAKAGKTIDWVDLDAGTLWNALLGTRVDRVPGDVALGLAHVFAEVAHADAARALLARAQAAGGDIPSGALTALQLEIEALASYRSLLEEERTPDQRIAAVKSWRDRHKFTEAFLLLDRRTATELPDLTRVSDQDAYLASWGIRPE